MKKLLLILLVVLNIVHANAQCWEKIASGGFHNLAIKEDGTLWGWGKNYSYALGALPENVPIPTQIGTDNKWVAISCGNSHNIALKSDGTLWSWGRNDAGQLGLGYYTNTSTPTQVGRDNNWAIICAGGGTASAAIKSDGTLWTWGYVDAGENLEIGDDVKSLNIVVPTQMTTDTDWKFVDVGHNHTVAIKKDGSLWSWGLNYHGELGLGTNVNAYTPMQVGTDTDWEIAFASNFMTAALKKDKSLWTWGQNTGGSLGNGSTSLYQTNKPVQVSNDKWQSVELGMFYFCGAIKDDGSLWTWGYNYYGSIGNGTVNDIGVPYLIPSETKWLQYAGGGDYSVALKEDGSLYTWGYNGYDQLGFNLDGNTVLTPAQVTPDCKTAGIEHAALHNLTIYPNPATNILTIDNPVNINIEKVTVFDVTGKTIIKQKDALTVNVQPLPTGIYFIKIQSGTDSTTHKFIKQ